MGKLNFELLKSLYCIHSKSLQEKKMCKFLKKWIRENVSDVVMKNDSFGNLYITKGSSEDYPCLCAHMDQVQDMHPRDFTCIDANGVILGYSPKLRKQCGLGGDDKNGLFIAMSCLQAYDVIKCAFFVGEEIGCVGSRAADVEFFKDCRFCIQIDRRGNSDMVTHIADSLCSEDFIKAVNCCEWGYNISDGLMTDVEALREKGVELSCINLSCGYYAPHSDEEFTVKEDVEKCYRFVCHIIEDCTGVYPHEIYCGPYENYHSLFDEDNFQYDCYDYLNHNASFEEVYAELKRDYPKLDKSRMREIFDLYKSHQDFGN